MSRPTTGTGRTDEQAIRDFDYGVGDELAAAVRRAYVDVAGRIRSAAIGSAPITDEARRAYEQAARLAESAATSDVRQV